MKRSALPSIILALAATSALAQAQPATTRSTTRPRGDFRTLVVSPMATPTPALKYQLQPDFADRIDGNAATQYLEALLMLPEEKFFDRLDAIDEAAGDDDADFARRIDASDPREVGLTVDVPPLVQTATLRTTCDWEFPARFEGVRTLLPNLNHLRQMANYLRFKFRYALGKDDIAAAIRLLQASTMLASRTDDGQTFIVNNLVSVGIEAQCMEQHATLLRRADAPNLYWALRRLPVPFGNLRGAVEAERGMLLVEFPVLRRVRAGDEPTGDDWRAFARQMADYASVAATGKPSTRPTLASDVAAGAMAFALAIPAREYYARTRRLTAAQVKSLDPLRVAAVYAFETYQQASDELYRWFPLPYPEMLPGLRAANERFESLRRSQPGNVFLVVAPSLGRVPITNARLDRTIAAITVVEAIRAYAAAHDGTLPPTLDAIVDTPPPMNPVTGKPFDYSVTGDVATIADDGKLVDWPLRYEVRLRK